LCGLVCFADGPDGLVPRLFRMRREMIALLKVGGDVDGHGVELPTSASSACRARTTRLKAA
jgi:hypothetical protein